MIFVIDLLIFCGIAYMQPDLSKEWTAILMLAHMVLLLVGYMFDKRKDDKIDKLNNTINEHLEYHRKEDR